MQQPHATLTKFGYPDSLVAEYDHWAVLLRPKQATLGALVLAAKSGAQAYGGLPAGAFAEQAAAVSDIETALRAAFGYDKINYLMLMMVDKEVHFHVLPRYAEPKEFAGAAFADPGWPGPPDLKGGPAPDDPVMAAIKAKIQSAWPDR